MNNQQKPPLYKIDIWTDGACSGNPGHGGWACVLQAFKWDGADDLPWSGEHVHMSGSDQLYEGGNQQTTSVQMEFTAILEGLKHVNPVFAGNVLVTVHTDSMLAVNSFGKWAEGWERRGWRKLDNSPVQNLDLVKPIWELTKKFQVQYKHVKGHSGIPMNERVNTLAQIQRDKHKPFTVTVGEDLDGLKIKIDERLQKELRDLGRDHWPYDE